MVEKLTNKRLRQAVNINGVEGYRLSGRGYPFRLGEEAKKSEILGYPTFQAAYLRIVNRKADTIVRFTPDGSRRWLIHDFENGRVDMKESTFPYEPNEVVNIPEKSTSSRKARYARAELVVIPSFPTTEKNLPESDIEEVFRNLEEKYSQQHPTSRR